MSNHDYITCQQLIDFIADYLDGSLPADSRHEFDRHLGVCPPCVRYLETYKQTVKLGKLALDRSDEPAAGHVPEGLIHAIRNARARGK